MNSDLSFRTRYAWPLPPLNPSLGSREPHSYASNSKRKRKGRIKKKKKKQAVVAKVVSQHCECTIWSIGDPGELTLSKLNPVD